VSLAGLNLKIMEEWEAHGVERCKCGAGLRQMMLLGGLNSFVVMRICSRCQDHLHTLHVEGKLSCLTVWSSEER